jgi:putative salt-induced outer membrane protein YdiY
VFVFAQGDYLRDTFKQINYVLSPSAGVGYKLVNTDVMLFAVDTGLGAIWERDSGRSTVSSGAYSIGERFSWKFSKSATIAQSIGSIWKTNDWSDSLHNFSLGLAASVTAHTELKVEMLDSYKNHPNSPTLKKNDTAVVTALVVKF